MQSVIAYCRSIKIAHIRRQAEIMYQTDKRRPGKIFIERCFHIGIHSFPAIYMQKKNHVNRETVFF